MADQTPAYPEPSGAHAEDRDATIRRVVLGAIPDVLAIYFFGSAARGDARPDSDLDIALLTAPGGMIPDTLGLMADLAGALG